jgi:hypothetical protein
MECKSFLDSPGVEVGAFNGKKPRAAQRYKLFSDARLRRVVLNRLTQQLVGAGFCRGAPRVRLGLAAGRINGDEDWLRVHFERSGWRLWGPAFIREELRTLSDTGYENSVAAVVAKVLLREPRGRKARSGVAAEV